MTAINSGHESAQASRNQVANDFLFDSIFSSTEHALRLKSALNDSVKIALQCGVDFLLRCALVVKSIVGRARIQIRRRFIRRPLSSPPSPLRWPLVLAPLIPSCPQASLIRPCHPRKTNRPPRVSGRAAACSCNSADSNTSLTLEFASCCFCPAPHPATAAESTDAGTKDVTAAGTSPKAAAAGGEKEAAPAAGAGTKAAPKRKKKVSWRKR